MRRFLRKVRSLARRTGWDIVRYRPMWSTLLGVERLPIRTVLDIGAFDGDSARIFRSYFPAAHIYCFEPQPEPLHALETWAATQHGMVHVLPFAVSNQAGAAELHYHASVQQMASLTMPPPGHVNGMPDAMTVSTSTVRLDEAVSAYIPLVDGVLVKIDVEGSERAVLEGGTATLRRCVACIMEFHAIPRFTGQVDFVEGLQALANIGLEYAGTLQHHLHTGHLMYFDAIFVNRERINAISER